MWLKPPPGCYAPGARDAGDDEDATAAKAAKKSPPKKPKKKKAADESGGEDDEKEKDKKATKKKDGDNADGDAEDHHRRHGSFAGCLRALSAEIAKLPRGSDDADGAVRVIPLMLKSLLYAAREAPAEGGEKEKKKEG